MLSAGEAKLFFSDCKLVRFEAGHVLFERGGPVRRVYFPSTCFVAMTAAVDVQSTLEVGLIGNEGMCGSTRILGPSPAPQRAVVQGRGLAWVMPIAALGRHLATSPALSRLLQRYLIVLFGQLSQSVVCTRFHVVEQRLARWLLMICDRAHADSFAVTQESLALMLGVRRASVSAAAGELQTRAMIGYKRGHLTIFDKASLRATACTCYAADLALYSTEFGDS